MIPIRSAWLFDIVVMCQQIASTSSIDVDHFAATVEDIIGTAIVNPHMLASSPLERLVLRNLLMETALRSGDEVHRRFHTKDARRCGFVSSPFIQARWISREEEPFRQFLQWSFEFATSFRRLHWTEVAERVANLLKSDESTVWTLPRLADAVGVSSLVVRHEFTNRFGMSIIEYRRQQRIDRALEMLSTTDLKVESIATMVGYRSKKNFYRAFRRVHGNTPSKFRRNGI